MTEWKENGNLFWATIHTLKSNWDCSLEGISCRNLVKCTDLRSATTLEWHMRFVNFYSVAELILILTYKRETTNQIHRKQLEIQPRLWRDEQETWLLTNSGTNWHLRVANLGLITDQSPYLSPKRLTQWGVPPNWAGQLSEFSLTCPFIDYLPHCWVIFIQKNSSQLLDSFFFTSRIKTPF